MATKWGIVSTARIAWDFVNALGTLSSDDHTVLAVASRSADKARDFAKKFDIPKSYGSYEDLAKDPDIEVVYIATVNSEHYPLIKMYLNHGKHVLSEKSLTCSLEHTKEVIELARKKKLFLMEGFWSRCFPVYERVRQELPSIGDAKLITVRFGVTVSDVERVYKPSLGGGGMLDIGGYTIQIATMVFGCRPEKIICDGVLMDTGVDEAACVILRYSGGRYAQISYNSACHFLNLNTAEIIGTKGTFEIGKPFWCPLTLKTTTPDYATQENKFPLKDGKYAFNFENSAGLAYEAECVRKCLLKGKSVGMKTSNLAMPSPTRITESDVVPHEHSIINAEVQAEVRRQLGAK